MEKSTPHCRLSVVRSLIAAGRVRATLTALDHANEMRLGLEDMILAVNALTPADFRKSMTTRMDHRIWQDVYCPMTQFGLIYVKLTVVQDVLIVSFKEA